jgi:hypothetical protein
MSKKRRTPKKQKTDKREVKSSKLDVNILIALGFICLLYFLYKTVPGYNYFVKRQIIKESRFIFENFNLTSDQKYQVKLKKDYKFIKYVKENTPDSAVILMPSPDVFKNTVFNQKGAWGVKSKVWSTYFLYPRILIQENERDIYPELYNRITHVMVIKQWGLDKLNYRMNQKINYAVLPISIPGPVE